MSLSLTVPDPIITLITIREVTGALPSGVTLTLNEDDTLLIIHRNGTPIAQIPLHDYEAP